MFKINWKVRFKNPQFLAQVILSVVTPMFAYYGLTGEDINTWGSLFGVILDALKNPYVLSIIGVSLYNTINDPTVSGLRDSEQALHYTSPKKEDDI